MSAKNARNKKTPGAGGNLKDGIRLLVDVRSGIQKARVLAGQDIQARLLEHYWELGKRLGQVQAAGLAKVLTPWYGRAYTEEALRRMARFAEYYPRRADWRPLLNLSWGHVVALLALDDAGKRGVYASECLRQGWSPALLREQIRGLWHVRAVLDRKRAPDAGKRRAFASPKVWEDFTANPDCSDFLGYTGQEPRDARGAVTRAMQDYFLNLQAGFCFVERRKRFQVGLDDFSLDLLLYHRELKRLFALAFEWEPRTYGPEDLMDFYLTWLDRNERRPGEQPPVGLVFKAGEKGDRLSLRTLDGEGGGVAWYQTALPPRVLVHQFYERTLASARGV